ncbi:MAG TPA: pentapeptide repeat-containing protein [Candidatus Cybelea sp.]
MTDWYQGLVTFVSAVSATALNALWQDALLVIFVWLLLRAWPRVNAATRYIVWSATLAAAFVIPVATTLAFFTPAHVSTVRALPAVANAGAPMHVGAAGRREAPAPHPAASVAAPRTSERLRVTLPVSAAFGIFGLWLVLASYSLVRLAIGLVRLEQLKRDALPLPVEYRDAMPQWLRANKGARDVRLCVSGETDVPIAVGLFDAMILVPLSLLERLSEPEVDQICLHELAHLRRADDWTNGLQRVISGLLGWNPATQFIGQQLDLEREVACDDWVLSFVGKVRPYALCLTKMAESASWPRHPIPAPGVFATRKHISLRIERLLGAGRNIATSLALAPAAAAVAVVAAIGLLIAFVVPSVAASPIAAPAARPLPAAVVAATDRPAPAGKAAPVKTVTRIVRVATLVTAAPSQTQMPSTSQTQLPSSSQTGKEQALDAKALADKITKSVAAGINRGFGVTVVAQAKTCVGCDYSGVNWPGRDLRNVNYNGVDFSKANLAGANLAGSSMNGADFSAANLGGASFRNAHLTGCDFSDANLAGADFTNARISGCQFTRARLGSSQLRDVLNGCKGCDFSRADLAELDLHGVRTNGDDFTGANLRNVNFAGAQLLGTDFSNAKLDGANLAGATLNGCDLSGVDLSHVDLSKTRVIGTDIRGQ